MKQVEALSADFEPEDISRWTWEQVQAFVCKDKPHFQSFFLNPMRRVTGKRALELKSAAAVKDFLALPIDYCCEYISLRLRQLQLCHQPQEPRAQLSPRRRARQRSVSA